MKTTLPCAILARMGFPRLAHGCLAATLGATSGCKTEPNVDEEAAAATDAAIEAPAEEEKDDSRLPKAEEGIPDWAKEHWSYNAPKRPAVPACEDKWCENPIDAFVLADLRTASVEPSADTDAPTLVRRLYLDLTGLPPTPEDSKKWSKRPVADLVDHLLASTEYAEHMTTWWLDLVRFADTVGYFGDQGQHVWPYRDWVIAAFYQGMPFDKFTEAQLAGDLLPDATEADLVASAYNRILPTSHENGVQAKEYLAIYAADRVSNLGSVWLGSTLMCVQCHDHPHDPFTQSDFYSLAAFFADVTESGDYKQAPNRTPTKRPPEMEASSPLDVVMRKEPRTGRVMFTKTNKKPRPIRILARGNWMDDTGEIVEPDVPELIGWLDAKHPKRKRATRLHLAHWLMSEEHPLTSRVVVNRLWARMFGRALSLVQDDFGIQGEEPVDAALLDWLAVEFMQSGWDIRHVLRLMAMSHTYRQLSLTRPELPPGPAQAFARQERVRLPAEVVRDQALALSGLLSKDLGGPSVFPYQPEGVWANLSLPHRTYEQSGDNDIYRRSVYTYWQRQFPHPGFTAFGAPSRQACSAERPLEYTTAQALALLNDTQMVEAARMFASAIVANGGRADDKRVDWAWERATARKPTDEERDTLLALLAESRTAFGADADAAKQLTAVGEAPVDTRTKPTELAAWTQVSRAVLNAGMTITRR